MVWFLVPVMGGIGAAGTIYGLHAMCNMTSIQVAQKLYGIDNGYTWPPLSNLFEERPQKHNGTAVGVLSAGTAAVATYLLMRRGMRTAIGDAANMKQPAKIDNFAQLAKTLAPGMGQRGAAALAAAVVGGAIRSIVDGNNMERGHVHSAPAR